MQKPLVAQTGQIQCNVNSSLTNDSVGTAQLEIFDQRSAVGDGLDTVPGQIPLGYEGVGLQTFNIVLDRLPAKTLFWGNVEYY